MTEGPHDPDQSDMGTADAEQAVSDAADETRTADSPLPPAVVDAAERLSRLAREAVDEEERAAYLADRDERLAAYDYTARVREDDARDVLVCHPQHWVADGQIRPDRIDDLDRGIERPLSGPGEGSDWDTVAAHNDDIVAAVRTTAGEVHGENARALADFASNHYAKPIDDLTGGELATFREEYFERNAWPSERQQELLGESIRRCFEKTDVPCPLDSSPTG